MALRYTKGATNERRLYEGGGYYYRASKGSCHIYIEPRGFFSGARYELRVGSEERPGSIVRGETDTVKKAKAIASKWAKGC